MPFAIKPEQLLYARKVWLASSIGLGISLYNKGEVVVLDGDGSLLMNPKLCAVSLNRLETI